MANTRESSMRSRYPYPPEGESVGCLAPTTVENVDGTVLSERSTAKGTWRSKPQVLEHPKVHRDKEDAYIGRSLRMGNVETPLGSASGQ